MVSSTRFLPEEELVSRSSSVASPSNYQFFPPEIQRRDYMLQSPQHMMMSSRDSMADSLQSRKRIAVACGRCRKRKIRCSGDQGNGEPCTNCRSANHEPCQFLRVSSEETALRGGEYSYPVDMSRHLPYRSATSSIHNMPASVAAPFFPEERGSSAYGASGRASSYYPVASFAGGYHEGTSPQYSMYPASYSTFPETSSIYPLGSNATAAKNTSELYAEAEASYNASAMPPTIKGTASRSVTLGEAASMPYQQAPSAATTSFHGDDRQTSATSSRRPLPTSAPRQERGQAYTTVYERVTPPNANGSPSSSPVEDTYYGGGGSPYPTASGSSFSRSTDMYTTSAADSLSQASASSGRFTGGSDMTYRYTDTTTHRSTAPAAIQALSNMQGMTTQGYLPSSRRQHRQPSHHYDGTDDDDPKYVMPVDLGQQQSNSQTSGMYSSEDYDRKPLRGVNA